MSITSLKNAKRTRRGYIADCPVCGYARALSVQVKDGRDLAYCHAGCDSRRVFDAVIRRDYLTVVTAKASKPPKPATSKGDYGLETYSKAAKAAGTLAETYLRNRLIQVTPEHFRYSLVWYSKEVDKIPALIMPVYDLGGDTVAVQAVFLSDSGHKAGLEPAKKTYGHLKGNAVHIGEPGERLIICEGAEDALTLHQQSGLPAWAALSAGNMAGIITPPKVRELIIAADNDGPGRTNAYKAAETHSNKGLSVKVIFPVAGCKDFNEQLAKGAF